MATLTQAEVVKRLENAAEGLTASALRSLQTPPRGPVLCSALVLHASGRTALFGIGDPSMRLQVLRDYARAAQDVAGFALIFDGYVSHQCTVCEGEGCATCQTAGTIKPKIDAIIAVVRTKWGSGSTKSIAYGFTNGVFTLHPERNEEMPYTATDTLDNYEMVFREIPVH